MKSVFSGAALAAALAVPLTGHSFSYDVLVGTASGQLTTGFLAHGGVPPGGGFAVDSITGQHLYPASFGDFAGGPRATNDPGFQGFTGTLPAGTIVSAQGMGYLEYWAPATPAWALPPSGEQVRLYGGIPTDISLAYVFCQTGGLLCDPALAAQYPSYAQGTAFSASGVSGPNPAIIDDADAAGAFHAHLDWFIEQPGGTPATGAYLVTFALVADGYRASEPAKILFNYGLTDAQYQAAFDARVFSVTPPIPEPPAVLLMLAGIAFLTVWCRRSRTALI
ncbi:MAG: PEP-CTERM sorting domain-containing protein [Nitrosospira sp.]|nr:PEP-CTERM sorting domain-containing protein [Nitrosospira sp.]